jgi:hypothetical protein
MCKDYDGRKKQLEDIRSDRPSLAIPIFDQTKKSYHKGVIECWANLGASLMGKVSKWEDPIGHQKDDNLPLKYVQILWAMSQIMCHMVNSTSWQEGKLHEFDRIEIKRRLEKLKGWL